MRGIAQNRNLICTQEPSHLKTHISTLLAALTSFVIAIAGNSVHAAGFQHGFAADAEGKPLEIGIWYPSRAAVKPMAKGPIEMNVAVNGLVEGKALPLVLISHGTGSSYLGHFDTAIALADAGFVVAAVTHAGDHYADQSRSIDVMDRPRQISRVIDHMLSTWGDRALIDPARIGMFGFSAGGFTALVNIGGIPDFSTIEPMCRQYPADFACRLLAKSGSNAAASRTSARAPAADARIKAAVVAAPALGFTFSPDGLKTVKVPVQLWRADQDELLPHPRYAEAVRLALPEAPEGLDYRVVANAGHFDFLAPCSAALASIAPAICASEVGFDRLTFHASFNAAAIGFLKKALGAGPER